MASIIEIEDEELMRCAVCRETALHKCSACKEVAYCGKQHQKEHWKLHKPKCKKLPYEIKSSPLLGRYLQATLDLHPGDRIARESPLIVGPKLALAEPICLGCHKPLNPNLADNARCPRCFWPACSARCSGLSDAHTHAPECAILKLGCETLLAYNDYKYEAILPLRCLILQRRSPKKYQELKDMEAHMSKRGPGTEVYEEIDSIVKYLRSNFLEKLPGDVLDDTSAKCLHWICGVIEVNGVDIGRYTQGLYSVICLMEHNCLPNAKYMFEPGTNVANLIASVNISKDTHISTMYTNALWGTQPRREHLAITKYFNCSCERCSDPTELGTYFSAMKCLNEHKDQGDCWILPVNPLDNDSDWTCGSCSARLNARDVHLVTSQLGEQVDKLVQENPNVKSLEEMLTKLEAMFHPHHYHCYAVKHSLIQLYGTQPGYAYTQLSSSLLERKISLCRELIWITNKLDPGHSRLIMYLAVLNYELHSALIETVQRAEKQPTIITQPPAPPKGKKRASKGKIPLDIPKENLESPVIPKDKRVRIIQEAKSLLEKNVDLLEHEPQFSTGYDMAVLAKISLAQVESTLKTYL
ncbi:histone-lysine N-methyltransferase ASHR1-like [Diaphorina citri]|uniref:Histone-lysine N-methyltransferase ASHR1-like n=2 Tax=Diaphorina citri TaxID=121845 RepID=A0A1S3D951_DIACI|nr:histone-lysine N-methyltransferase ASHR1-like [Diaphorina citri]